jgi:lipopolysaccharide export system protein LptA
MKIPRCAGWVMALAAAAAWAQTAALPPAAPALAPSPRAGAPATTTDDIVAAGDLTVITSDTLTYDASRGYAVFEGNVVVSDPQMKMKADKLTVYFEGKSEVKSLLAEGRVAMSQLDRRAWAQKATYDVAAGRVTLTGDPRVMRGKDLLVGDKITFWRDEQRMLVESAAGRTPTPQQPGARLILYPEEGRSPLEPTGAPHGR